MAYMAVVGAMPALVRATLMASLWHLAALQARAEPQEHFFTAGLVILAIKPSNIFDEWISALISRQSGRCWRWPRWSTLRSGATGLIGSSPAKRAAWLDENYTAGQRRWPFERR